MDKERLCIKTQRAIDCRHWSIFEKSTRIFDGPHNSHGMLAWLYHVAYCEICLKSNSIGRFVASLLCNGDVGGGNSQIHISRRSRTDRSGPTCSTVLFHLERPPQSQTRSHDHMPTLLLGHRGTAVLWWWCSNPEMKVNIMNYLTWNRIKLTD